MILYSLLLSMLNDTSKKFDGVRMTCQTADIVLGVESDMIEHLPGWAFIFLAIVLSLVLTIVFIYPAKPIELGKLGRFGYADSTETNDRLRKLLVVGFISVISFLAGIGLMAVWNGTRLPSGSLLLVSKDIECPSNARRLANLALPTSADEASLMPSSVQVAREGESPALDSVWPTLIYKICHFE